MSTADQLASGNPDAPAKGGFDPARMLRVLQQRAKLVVAAVVACGLFAVVTAKLFATPLYRSQGTLIYKGLPIADTEKSLVPVQDFDTLFKLVTSQANLESLNAKRGMAIPPQTLARFFKLDEPSSAKSIAITLDWPDPAEGAAMVNSLMEVHIEGVAAERVRNLEQHHRAMEKNLENCRVRLGEARKAYQAILDKNNVQNLKVDLERIAKDIQAMSDQQSKFDGDVIGAREEIRQQQKRVAKLQEDAKNQVLPKDFDEEYKKRLQDLERQMKTEKGQLSALEVQYKAAQKQVADVERLFQARVIARVEYEKIRDDAATLEAQYKALKELVALSERSYEDEKKNPTGGLIQKEKERLRELEASVIKTQGSLEGVRKTLQSRIDEQRRLIEIQRKAEGPEQTLENLEKERQDLDRQITALRKAKSSEVRELVIYSPATPSTEPYSSNAKKLIAVAFGLPLMLVLAAILGLAMRADTWKAESLASKLKLPILARASGGPGQPKRLSLEEARGLALRMRQYVTEKGGMILFSPLNEGEEVDDLAAAASHYLAMRDEKVLILDARIARTELSSLVKFVERPVEVAADVSQSLNDTDPCQSGLVQYLVFEGQNLNDFIHPTSMRGVYYMPAGGPHDTTDALASEPMKEMLQKLRKQYSLILAVGPPVTQHATDNEILAAYVNGIVVVMNGSANAFAVTEPFFQSLKEANAPLLGTVVCV
jgi:uncharacterized protein involved in exopolysaccharide biosynthesis/Mrp family chromosome partitioning ATPase